MKTLTKILLAAIGMMASGIEAQPFNAVFTASDTPGVVQNDLFFTVDSDPYNYHWLASGRTGTNINFAAGPQVNYAAGLPNPIKLWANSSIIGTNGALVSGSYTTNVFVFDTNNYAAYYLWLQTNGTAVVIPQPITIDPPTGLNVPSPR